MFPTNLFKEKHVLIGITGGIAAYKTCEIIRYLVTYGAEVRAMMTASAKQFIGEITIETLTDHPVYSEMFPETFAATHHITAADRAEVGLVIPATANIIGKLANGIADDFVSTTLLAMHCPVVVAPAMNEHMWFHPANQNNLEKLRQWGYLLCNPEEGFLAEGYSGVGRLARPEYIAQYLYKAAHPQRDAWEGKKVVITAGRTEEPLDPVRMFTNRSSGKMGFALAWEAFARGADVTLIYGPGNLTPPVDVNAIPVQTAEEMYSAAAEYFPGCDIYISAAAIADYRPAKIAASKIKKSDAPLQIEMVRTTDVLKTLSAKKRPEQLVVGFAVETDDTEKNALKKLKNKNLDMVVLNDPSRESAAFAVDTNVVTIFGKDFRKEVPAGYKLDVARAICEAIDEVSRGEQA